jgi:hypothetical protein
MVRITVTWGSPNDSTGFIFFSSKFYSAEEAEILALNPASVKPQAFGMRGQYLIPRSLAHLLPKV